MSVSPLIALLGYTVPTIEALIILLPILVIVWVVFLRQHKGTPIWAIMIFKGNTTGFLFQKGVVENLDLQELTIKIKKNEELTFDSSKNAPLEIRVNAYRWVRLFFVSEASKQTLDYRYMVDQGMKEQNLAGEVSMRLMTRAKSYIEMIMVQAVDDIKHHIPYIIAGGGVIAIVFMLMQFLF